MTADVSKATAFAGSASTVTVEVWADVCCPFAHLSLVRTRAIVEEVRRLRPVKFRVRSWPLEWVNGEPMSPSAVYEEVEDLRAGIGGDLFRAFDPANFPRSSILAMGTAAVANETDPALGEAFSFAVREALFERGLPIGEVEVLAEVASEVGVRVPELEEAERAVRRDWEEGISVGVVGSPHYMICGRSMFCPFIHKQEGTDPGFVFDEARLSECFEVMIGCP